MGKVFLTDISDDMVALCEKLKSSDLLHEYRLIPNLAQKQQGGQDLRHKTPSTGKASGLPNLIFEDVSCK